MSTPVTVIKEKKEMDHPTFLENNFSLNTLDLGCTFPPLNNKFLIYFSPVSLSMYCVKQ